MIVCEIAERTTAKLLKTILSDTLKKICKTDKDFGKLCEKFAEEEGTKIDLVLG